MRSQESGVRSQNVGRASSPGGIGNSATRRGVAYKNRNTTFAFTLIEVLAAMAVLVVLVLALTRLFMQASDITKRGTTTLMRNSTIDTVMETIAKDLESMVVNERLPCYILANAANQAGFGFDEIYFITTSGDPDDDRAYQLRRYYVREQLVTNNLGVPFFRFELYRDVWIFAVADDFYPGMAGRIPVDVMEKDMKWWKYSHTWGEEGILLADNVVRFDVYCLGWDGRDWMNANAGKHEFDSTRGPAGFPQYKHMPPAAFDIYLQVTSPEAAEEGGMALVPGVDEGTKQKARAMMIRESASIFSRQVPVMGAAQFHHPANHYTDP